MVITRLAAKNVFMFGFFGLKRPARVFYPSGPVSYEYELIQSSPTPVGESIKEQEFVF